MVVVGLIDSSEQGLWEGPLLRGISHSSPLPCKNVLPDIQWLLLFFTFVTCVTILKAGHVFSNRRLWYLTCYSTPVMR